MLQAAGFAFLASCGGGDSTGPASFVLQPLTATNNQTALVGYPTNFAPAVRVTDVANNPIGNVGVTFTIVAGGGSIVGATTVNSGANGFAQLAGWVVGANSGTNTITASATGATSVNFTATGVTSGFSIVLQNIGPPLSAGAQSAFDSAVARWSRIIIAQLPAVTGFSTNAGDCGNSSPALPPQTIQNIKIFVDLDSIDGPGKILGQSGPCYIRNQPDNRTVLGIMNFDTADVASLQANGRLKDVILHEMGHVLGFGTLWDPTTFACLNSPASVGTTPDTFYSCAKARAAFDSIGGTSYTGGNKVPIENCAGQGSSCGSGTFNSHWRESTFFNELMTGFLNGGSTNPLSVLTIASMGDLGYTVNYGEASVYTRTFTVASPTAPASFSGPVIDLGNDILRLPIRVVNSRGQLMRILQP